MAIKLLKRTEFASNVLTLMTGTAIAQAIPIAISPILTRIYSPNDFGVFGLYLAIVSIIAVAAAGRYELAIMLPKKDEDALNILVLSVIVSFFVCLLLFILILLFQNSFILLFLKKFSHIKISEIRFWLFLIPFSVFFISLYQIFNYWSTRQKTFKLNAIAKVGQSSIYSTGSLGLSFVTQGPIGLILGNVLGFITAFFILSWRWIKNFKTIIPLISKKLIKENAVKYKAFPIVNAGPALLSTMQDQGIIFIIAYFFTSHVVGFYSFVIRIVNLPVGLIGASMFQVFYQKASTLYNNNQSIRPTVVKLYIRSFLIGLPIFGVLFFFAPQIFSIVFSEKWRYSGEIAQIIAPWIFLNFISSPISSLPLITNNQKIAMYFVIVDFFFRIVALTIGGFLGSFKIGITIMTVTCSMVLICALYWYYKLSGKVNKSDIIESHSEK